MEERDRVLDGLACHFFLRNLMRSCYRCNRIADIRGHVKRAGFPWVLEAGIRFREEGANWDFFRIPRPLGDAPRRAWDRETISFPRES